MPSPGTAHRRGQSAVKRRRGGAAIARWHQQGAASRAASRHRQVGTARVAAPTSTSRAPPAGRTNVYRCASAFSRFRRSFSSCSTCWKNKHQGGVGEHGVGSSRSDRGTAERLLSACTAPLADQGVVGVAVRRSKGRQSAAAQAHSMQHWRHRGNHPAVRVSYEKKGAYKCTPAAARAREH